jgi:hypothetical protein
MVERVPPVDDVAGSPRRWVRAPEHPLADRLGRVPVEVFEVPPEMVEAVRSAPIRVPDTEGRRPVGPGSGPSVLEPEPLPATEQRPPAPEPHAGRLDVHL